MKKKIPEFSSEAEERKFWQENDSSDYIDWSDAENAVFSKLKPSTRKPSIRLPETMIEDLKDLFKNKTKNIMFAYIFGSRASNEHSESSDLDIAVYLEKTSPNSDFDTKIDLYAQINRTIKINDIDIVIMNQCKNIVLLHQITTQGKVLCDYNPDFRKHYEQKVLHSALDFLSHRKRVMGV